MGKRKVCKGCGRRRVLSAYYPRPDSRDGREARCKACVRARNRAARKARVEAARAYDRARSVLPHRRAHVARTAREWRQRHPGRYRAQNALNNAVRDGKVTKPDRCEQCGTRGRLHGHHHDYRKPLEVTWLCVPCHAARHGR